MSPQLRVSAAIPNLEPLEVFEYYDGPRFYSCRDLAGQIYLVYWIGGEGEDTEWLYVKASRERYSALRDGSLAVAEVLGSPEEYMAYVVTSAGSEFTVAEIEAGNINGEWLPPIEYRLSRPSDELDARDSNAVALSKATNRDVLDLAFKKASNTYEIGCGKLGRLLEAAQNLVFALASRGDAEVKKIPEAIKFDNELLVTGFFASSFGVRLQSRSADLLDSGQTSSAIEVLAELVGKISTPDILWSHLRTLNILSRSRFKHLLRVTIDSEVAVSIECASPTGNSRRSEATISELIYALKTLEAIEDDTARLVQKVGRLVGVDVKSDFFALVLEGGALIKGRLNKPLEQRSFEVPSFVLATIEERHSVDALTDRERWTYTLLDFEQQHQDI